MCSWCCVNPKSNLQWICMDKQICLPRRDTLTAWESSCALRRSYKGRTVGLAPWSNSLTAQSFQMSSHWNVHIPHERIEIVVELTQFCKTSFHKVLIIFLKLTKHWLANEFQNICLKIVHNCQQRIWTANKLGVLW